MTIEKLAHEVAAALDAAGEDAIPLLPGVFLFRRTEPTEVRADIYEPIVCLILQGEKETSIGESTLVVGAGQTLLVSHDVPIRARVTRASRDAPYLSIVFSLDIPMLRSLYEEVGDVADEASSGRTLEVADVDERMIGCLGRYLALAHDPVEARVLAPMLQREMHFRLLMSPSGAMLRHLLRHDSHASHIARAIARIRRDFRAPLAIPELAREVGMSASSFHKHFRDITSSTPLQYQKDLRLLEARRMLVEGQGNVTVIAYEVGYRSPNQFSREYSRKFGVPPSAHLAQSA